MSSRASAWIIGACTGSAAVYLIGNKFVSAPQNEMLLSLRRALLTADVRQSLLEQEKVLELSKPVTFREALNLALISVSDRLIFGRPQSTD